MPAPQDPAQPPPTGASPQGPPAQLPLGLALTRTSRLVARAFDHALAEAGGGSLPVWLVLLNLTIRGASKQRELAEAVGISEATLTHHLSALEWDGLVTRTRQPENRRVQLVELTEKGKQRFLELRTAAIAFDARLRNGLDDEATARLGQLLNQVSANVAPDHAQKPPWEGLIEKKEKP